MLALKGYVLLKYKFEKEGSMITILNEFDGYYNKFSMIYQNYELENICSNINCKLPFIADLSCSFFLR